MNRFVVLIVAAVFVMVAGAPLRASAEDKCNGSNPCADKEKCVRLGDTDKQCRKICCNDDQCDGEDVCFRSFCVTEEEETQLSQYYGKLAAAARAKALADANAALKAAQGDVEKTRLALIEVLKAEYILADLDLTVSHAESTESSQTWTDLTEEANRDGAGDLHSKWDLLKTKKEALDKEIAALTGAMAVADGLIKAPGTATIENVQASLTSLQDAHGDLKVALAELQAAHKVAKGEEKRNFDEQLDAEKKKAEAAEARATAAESGLRPHELGLMGYFFNFLPNERMVDDHAMVAFARFYYRYHFLLKDTFRPFVGGGVEGGALPDGRGYMGPAAELGFRAGDPSGLMFFETWGDAGWRIGFYEGSGNHWFAGGGLGPGFNLSRGSFMFGPCYSSSMPGFDGKGASYEDNFVGVCLRGSGLAGSPN